MRATQGFTKRRIDVLINIHEIYTAAPDEGVNHIWASISASKNLVLKFLLYTVGKFKL